MKFLLIDEAYPINTRNTKILSSLNKNFQNAEIHILTWDRSNCFEGDETTWHYHLYKKSASYGNKLQKLVGLFGYKRFCKTIINNVKPDVIIASHWNNLLMMPSVDYKRHMVIYENLDAPTGPWVGRRLLNCIEYWYMKRIALTVHASRFYTEIYPKHFPQLVLENKPTIKAQPVAYNPGKELRIVFLGNIRYIDILKNLVDAVRGDEDIRLYFHGGGPDYRTLVEYTKEIPNVTCTGVYKYEDIETFYQNADLIWAAYPNKDFNVKYAISNKFHESIAYGVPAIYADKTSLGKFAISKHLGFEVDPYSQEKIRSLLGKFKDNVEILRETSTSLCAYKQQEESWDEDFSLLVTQIQKFFRAS